MSERTSGAIKPVRAFFCIVFWGISFFVLIILCWMLWDIFWTDIVGHNPHRSLEHAVFILPLMALPVGLLFAIAYLSAALMAAASIAALSARKHGRVLLWPLIAATPLYACLIYGQFLLVPTIRSYATPPIEGEPNLVQAAVMLTALLLLVLFGSWWVIRMRSRSTIDARNPVWVSFRHSTRNDRTAKRK